MGVLMTTYRPLEERFWEKVEPTGFCWNWTASTRNGYGQISVGGRKGRIAGAHRVAYELLIGPIPDGLVIDHLCRNTLCVNPDHLEPVTVRENALRAPVIGRKPYDVEMCKKGLHRMDEMSRPNGKYRLCVPCRRVAAGKWGKGTEIVRRAGGLRNA